MEQVSTSRMPFLLPNQKKSQMLMTEAWHCAVQWGIQYSSYITEEDRLPAAAAVSSSPHLACVAVQPPAFSSHCHAHTTRSISILHVNRGRLVHPPVSFLHLFWKRSTFVDRWQLLSAGCLPCHWTNSVKHWSKVKLLITKKIKSPASLTDDRCVATFMWLFNASQAITANDVNSVIKSVQGSWHTSLQL